MSGIKSIIETNGIAITTEEDEAMNAVNEIIHLESLPFQPMPWPVLPKPATAMPVLEREAVAVYGMPEPEGCGAPGCARPACGLDDWRDYCDGWNTGGRLFDDAGDPRDVGVPQDVESEGACRWFLGVHCGWMAAQYHADRLCVAPDNEPDTGEEQWLGRDDVSLMDSDQPEPGEGEAYGPDDECAWLENHDDARRYDEGVFHITEPEDIHG